MSLAGALHSGWYSRCPRASIENFITPKRIAMVGQVQSLPEIKTHGKKVTISFVLNASSVLRWEKGRQRKVPVSGRGQVFLIQPSLIPEVGDELRLYGHLQSPRRVLNPGEFDYGKYLDEKNIRVVFQCIGKKSVTRLQRGNSFEIPRQIAQIRRWLGDYIEKLYSPSDAAILKALVLGIRTQIAPDTRDHFMKTGTVHILAISGLNITMIAGSFFLLFLILGMNHKKSSIITIVIVMLYVGLAGAGLPVQRAGCAAVLVLVASLSGRSANSLNILSFAFFVMLLLNPKSFWSVGFQLSFLSVFSLIAIQPLVSRFTPRGIALGSSLAVLLGTFPFILYYFNIFSPVSLLANVIAIPLFDAALFLTLFSLLLSWVPLAGILLIKGVSFLLTVGLVWIEWLAGWKWGYWFLTKPSWSQMTLYYLCLLGILGLRQKNNFPARWLFMGLCAGWSAITLSFFWPAHHQGFKATLLASGKNPIAHLRFSNQAHWMMNAGRGFPSDQGEWLVAPYLRQCGIRKLEGVLLTGLSRKNTGGLRAISRNFSFPYLLYPRQNQGASVFQNPDLRPIRYKTKSLKAGDMIRMDQETMRVIAATDRGMALLIMSPPWRMMILSSLDPELLEMLSTEDDFLEIHAVWLPSLEGTVSEALGSWLKKKPALLVVSPEIPYGWKNAFAALGIRFLSVNETGALTFERKGRFLEIGSLIQGRLGFFSYS